MLIALELFHVKRRAMSASGTERTFERCPTAVFQLSVERQVVHGKPTNGSGQLVMALQ